MLAAFSTLSSLQTYLIRPRYDYKRGNKTAPGSEELDENYTDTSVAHRIRGVNRNAPKIDGDQFVRFLRERGFEDIW